MTQIGFIICEVAFWTMAMLFMHKENRRKHFPVTIGGSTAIVGSIILVLSIYCNQEMLIWDVTSQCLIAGLVLAFLKVNWNITTSIAVYNIIWARIMWWLLTEVWKLIALGIVYRVPGVSTYILAIIGIVFYAIFIAIFSRTIMRWLPNDGKKYIGPRQLVSAILVSTIFEIIAFMPEMRNLKSGIDRWTVLFLLQIICAIVLYLQNELFRKSMMKQELDLMNLLLEKEQEQYRLSRENIAIINQKCHDLKHQLRAIRKSTEADKNQYIKEVEESIKIYEAIVKTGNEVLDTILTEKSLYCKERGIVVSCVADGALLSFMHTMDLYSLFGNALDNAIEAVEKIETEEHRQIDVIICKQQSFLVINIVNPVAEKLLFEDGLPITTKQDKNYHGFGVKSMKYIVRKYNGFINATEEDGCFSLKMLIPIP